MNTIKNKKETERNPQEADSYDIRRVGVVDEKIMIFNDHERHYKVQWKTFVKKGKFVIVFPSLAEGPELAIITVTKGDEYKAKIITSGFSKYFEEGKIGEVELIEGKEKNITEDEPYRSYKVSKKTLKVFLGTYAQKILWESQGLKEMEQEENGLNQIIQTLKEMKREENGLSKIIERAWEKLSQQKSLLDHYMGLL